MLYVEATFSISLYFIVQLLLPSNLSSELCTKFDIYPVMFEFCGICVKFEPLFTDWPIRLFGLSVVSAGTRLNKLYVSHEIVLI